MPTTLLLADDSVTIQKVVNLTFADEDVVIEAVGSGDQAIERARILRPDIVLADIFMPGRNGYEVCDAIKEDAELRDIPVVLLVGTFEPFDEAEAARVHCDAYLTKPFDTAELVQTVHALVERRHAAAGRAVRRAVAGMSAAAEPSIEPVDDAALHAVAGAPAADPNSLISSRTRESFLGSNSILDLFGPGAGASPATVAATEPAEGPQVIPFPIPRDAVAARSEVSISDELIDVIVERIVRRLSQDVVREVAWEVVPELAENMIQQYLDQLPPGRSRS
jgi:CheY-like chemotaxis protein